MSMRVYWMSKVLHLTQIDHDFREAMRNDPEKALEPFPLTDEERRAFLEGDVAWLYQQGIHGALLIRLARFDLVGVNLRNYFERLQVLLTEDELAELEVKSQVRAAEDARAAARAAQGP